MKKILALVALSLTVAGCASVNPLVPLSGGTARQAWQELSGAAGGGGTLSSYASVRVTTPEGRRTFRATIQAGADGAVRMAAFTPVGTEVFAFEVRDEEMVFADHTAKKWWRGPFAEVARQLGIPEALGAADFARLLFGMPPGSGEADISEVGRGIVRRGGLEYELTGVGLAKVSEEGAVWSVRYDPASFPPEKVTFEDDGGRSIIVRHLDLSHSAGKVEPLVVDPAYVCCYRPVISPE